MNDDQSDGTAHRVDRDIHGGGSSPRDESLMDLVAGRVRRDGREHHEIASSTSDAAESPKHKHREECIRGGVPDLSNHQVQGWVVGEGQVRLGREGE